MALPAGLVRISPLLLLLVVLPFCAGKHHAPREFRTALHSGSATEHGFVVRRSIAEAPADINVTTNSSFILAADRTHRKDPLNGFNKYQGGWNISEVHYWASVGYTAYPLFLVALLWFVLFFLLMLGICCHHCCCPHHSYNYSRLAYALSLIFLILFTCAAIAGSIVLYDGQGKFHSSTTTTLDFIVDQADFTVDNLRNLSDSLSAAKKVDIGQFLLPADVMNQINEIQGKLNSSANDLATRTSDNSAKIQKLLNRVRLALIIIAAVMLLLAFVGFFLSIFGLEFLVNILVVVGWILVTGTFILCGVFLLLHNVVGDTCVSMDQWVAHPTEHTALDDIIPCVEPATANESLTRSRQVTSQLVNLVNQVITNVSNQNFPPAAAPFYYNQSGPLMPTLCNPFTPDLNNRTCTRGEVSLDNATQVWRSFECQTTTVSGAEICTTVGRLTPRIYRQMAAGVNVSLGLYQYGPFLVQLEDCTFVRDTFTNISQNYCPGLERYSKWVYIGLVLVSTAVMLSLIFWVIYARERRHRVYNKQHQGVAGQNYPRGDDKPVPMGA
ncbi:uncharacterized protein LOC100835724 [Brachypodium distachyon]|uniref:Uncharacterized protein n=2 Tax=Brachypodium distachyon TaxID=15368 RepID=I1IDJ3_BRADI|nr:uncharacterized protein LOC100835724 [Brachypodium distachyon]KQK01187.1 hypothetical protein BRADI_3g54320v3 [Brachypodium distachyon]|eukprot:XP_003570323.1 uncharacterized protein LOC100835724 [Brachypodium distachyon]